MTQAIVFDLDGTLVDSREDLFRAIAHMQSELGLPAPDRHAVLAQVGKGARYLVEHSLPEGARDPGTVDRGVALFRDHYAEHLADHTRPFPGVPEALAALARDRALAVLTNKPGDLARTLLGRLGLDGHFRAILGGGDVPALKPAPDGLQAALARLGARPEASWYVGDMPLDLEVGRSVGCRVAAVAWGLTPEDRLAAAGPDRLLPDPDALASLVR